MVAAPTNQESEKVMTDLMQQGLNDFFQKLGMNDSQRKRFHEARNWTAADFLKWYCKTSHASRQMTADYLYGMSDADVKALSRVLDDLADDLARHRKRKLCIEQLNENEQLKNW
jgi:hypothetical protein